MTASTCAEVRLDQVDDLLLDLVGKGVAVDALRIEAGGVRGVFEGGGVVPAGAAGAPFLGRFLEENAEGRRVAAECRRDARRQAVPGGGADDEHPARHSRRADPSISRSRSGSAHWPRSLAGWAVTQINPRTFGLMIMAVKCCAMGQAGSRGKR